MMLVSGTGDYKVLQTLMNLTSHKEIRLTSSQMVCIPIFQ